MPLLLLDLDDTLVQRAPIFHEWAEKYLAEHGHDAARIEELVEADFGGHVSRRDFHRRLVSQFAETTSYAEFVGPHEEAVSGGYRLTSAVRQALDDTRAAGWSLGVVTNGYTRRQGVKLTASGLLHLVDGVCISEEVGTSKPDPAIFALVAERAGTTLDGAWMVGDNLDADITGAHNAGLRSVWVHRSREWLDFTSGTAPDLEADNVLTAIDLVRSS